MNYTMETSDREIFDESHRFFDDIIHILKNKFNAEIINNSGDENAVELLCLNPPKAYNMQTRINLKCLRYLYAEQISVEILGIGRIEKIEGKNYELHVAGFNKNNFDKDFKLLWDEKNHNFAIRKVIPMEVISIQRQTYGGKEFFFNAVSIMMNNLINCVKEAIGSSRHSIDGYAPVKTTNIGLKKKMEILELFKFKFEKDRKNREKSTKGCDLYTPSSKNHEEKNSFQAETAIEGMYVPYQDRLDKEMYLKELEKNYENILELYNQHEHKKVEGKKSKETKKPILSAIRVYKYEELPKTGFIEGFKHLHVIEAHYATIFSVNMLTNKELMPAQLPCIKEERSILVRKEKIKDYGESSKKSTDSFQPFDIEKEILLVLKQYFHSSICSFYVEEYENKSEIEYIYSPHMPENSIKFGLVEIDESTNLLKDIFLILRFLTQVADGLCFLSSHKIVHRDLKPLNIMLDENGTAKIIDFGSSAPAYPSLHSIDPVLFKSLRSTRDYFPKYNKLPEEIKSIYKKDEYNRHSSFDIYSLGVITEAFLEPYIVKAEKILFIWLVENIQYFINKCKVIQPDDRITSLEASLFLRFLAASFQLLLKKNDNH